MKGNSTGNYIASTNKFWAHYEGREHAPCIRRETTLNPSYAELQERLVDTEERLEVAASWLVDLRKRVAILEGRAA